MRRPYRERLRIILDELGAGVGGRSDDLNETIRRASPALRETDKVLDVLARQNQVLKNLTSNADVVIGDLADNSKDVGRFVKETEDVATTSAERRRDIAAGLQRLPTFLRELRPTMAELGATADASTPAPARPQRVGRPAHALPQRPRPVRRVEPRQRAHARQDGRQGAARDRAAKPTVAELTKTTAHAPELANNLGDRPRATSTTASRAVEKDQRSPGGQGYTGFEAVLQYIFDQMQAINIYDENGYILKVNLSASECSDYQNADSLKRKEKQEPGFLSRCLAVLGPNQPGVTTADPTDTGVDDRRRAEPVRQVARRRRASPRRRKDTPTRARTRPASPTSRRRSRSCCKRRRRREHAVRLAVAAERERPERPAPERPVRRRSVPNGPAAPASVRRIPQALLDYLLEPMRGRAASSVFANPVLVGAVTVLS